VEARAYKAQDAKLRGSFPMKGTCGRIGRIEILEKYGAASRRIVLAVKSSIRIPSLE
jgi:hypothetical protein